MVISPSPLKPKDVVSVFCEIVTNNGVVKGWASYSAWWKRNLLGVHFDICIEPQLITTEDALNLTEFFRQKQTTANFTIYTLTRTQETII